jgi:hypothetical protein
MHHATSTPHDEAKANPAVAVLQTSAKATVTWAILLKSKNNIEKTPITGLRLRSATATLLSHDLNIA